MRVFVGLLGCLLAIGTAAVAFADYAHVPVDSPLGLRLGRLYLLKDDLAVESARTRIDRAGFADVARVFDAVLERDPASAYHWCDTGEALLHAGKRAEAERCYLRAAQLAPLDVRILLNIGDFYSAIGEPHKALKNFSQLLRETGAPTGDLLTANVFAYYEGMHVVQNHLLDEAIPDTVNASAYLAYLIQRDDAAGTREVWDWACKKGFDDDPTAIQYAKFMFGKQQYEAAAQGWACHFARRNDGYPQSTLIFNGGFEYEFTGGPFDWTFAGPAGTKGTRDHQIHRAGEYSYRIDFTGDDNADFRHFSQNVYVHPGRYRFEAWVRTANLTSDQGVRFRLRTSRDSTITGLETDALSGTSDWTRLTADVDVPPGRPLLEVLVARHPSLRIDNQLSGTVWIDSVQLTPR